MCFISDFYLTRSHVIIIMSLAWKDCGWLAGRRDRVELLVCGFGLKNGGKISFGGKGSSRGGWAQALRQWGGAGGIEATWCITLSVFQTSLYIAALIHGLYPKYYRVKLFEKFLLHYLYDCIFILHVAFLQVSHFLFVFISNSLWPIVDISVIVSP